MGIEQALTDRNSAESQLLHRKAQKIVRHAGFHRSELKDVEQELVLEVLVKIQGFDPKIGCEQVFISQILDSKGISMVRARIAAKRDYRRNAGSLNASVRNADRETEELSQIFPSSVSRNHTSQSRRSDQELLELQMDVEETLSQATDQLRQVAEFLKVKSEFAASRELGLGRRQTAQCVSQLRQRFESGNLQVYL